MKKIVCVLSAFILAFCFSAYVSAEDCSAAAAAVIGGQTQELLWGKNSDTELPMASTTKIMTALILCEEGGLEREITVTPEMVAVEGSSMGLLPGDRVTLHDLLYGMMLASGNDAANTVAITLGGSVSGFVAKMNERAMQMGLTHTHFETPSGLDSVGHYTTAYELAIIAANALENKDFAAAASSKTATLCYGNPPYKRTLSNHNRLLKMYDDVVGVKTGFTKKSGRCLVSAAKSDGKTVIAVTLNDPNDWSDHRRLLDLGLSRLENVSLAPENITKTVRVIGGEKNAVDIDCPDIQICTVSPDTVSCDTVIMPFVFAPVDKGEKIGFVRCMQDGKILYEKPVTAAEGTKSKKIPSRSLFITLLKNILVGLT